jgi:hypothetical protein
MAQNSPATKGKTTRGRGGGFASRAAAPKLFLYGIAGLFLSLAIVFVFPQLHPPLLDRNVSGGAGRAA